MKFWLIFGLIFSGIVSYCIIESILNFSMRSILSSKKKLGMFILVFSLIFTIFDMDFMNYDRRIPTLDEIESLDIDPVGFDISVQNYDNKIQIFNQESIAAVLAIADISIKNTMSKYEKNTDSKNTYFDIVVRFNLKNGNTIIRQYSYATKEEALPIFAKIYDTKEFKYKYHPIFSLNDDEILKSNIEYINLFSDSEEDIINKEIKSKNINQSILKAIQDDFLNMKAKDLNLNEPIAILTLYKNDNIGSINIPIYRQYENTLEIINKYSYINATHINSKLIKRIESYEDKTNNNNYEEKILITDKRQIDKFLETNLLNYSLHLNPFIVIDSRGWSEVYFYDSKVSSKNFISVKPISIK